MREVLVKKLEDLGNEARALVGEREKILTMIQDIEVRLHQISGAISEIDNMLKEDDKITK